MTYHCVFFHSVGQSCCKTRSVPQVGRIENRCRLLIGICGLGVIILVSGCYSDNSERNQVVVQGLVFDHTLWRAFILLAVGCHSWCLTPPWGIWISYPLFMMALNSVFSLSQYMICLGFHSIFLLILIFYWIIFIKHLFIAVY